MTEFQKIRLEYFIKEANKHGWVRLAPGDKDIFQTLTIDTFDKASKLYWEGYKDGEEYERNKKL